MKCDLCGTKEVTAKAQVEGVMVSVCESCARFGKVVTAVQPQITMKQKERLAKQEAKAETERKNAMQKPETLDIIVQDYARRVREARERRGILPKDFAKQVAEKESVILHIESGKMRPNMDLARKLERTLKISLVETIEVKDEKLPASSRDTMTFGDLIKS